MLRNQPYAFTVSLQDAYSVVRAEGELDIASVAALGAAVNNARGHAPRVIVDLRAVTFMDTFALSALIALEVEARASEWSMHCIAGAGIQRLLDLADSRGALRWIAPEQLAR